MREPETPAVLLVIASGLEAGNSSQCNCFWRVSPMSTDKRVEKVNQ